jgi:hypothetical protein
MNMMVRLRREDDGLVLIMAIAFLAMFGVFAATLLGFATTNQRAHQVFEDRSDQMLAADGAITAAIEAIRTDLAAGRDPTAGGSCPGASPIPAVEVNWITPVVTCQGQPGSGTGAPGELAAPPHALLSLGSVPGEDGIVRDGTAGVSVDGRIFSHSSIRSPGGVFTVNGRVDAVGECSGNIVSLAPPLHCSNKPGGAALAASAPDPGFAPAISFAPARQTVPVCPPLGQTVTLSPGWYDDAAALNALTNGACPGRTIHLTPAAAGVGVFYLDLKGAGDHAWVINDPTIRVVGGTPKGWVAGVPTLLPGACKTAQDPAPNHGVQIILGGDSQIHAEAGAVELCAQPNDMAPQIAVYGVSEGTGPTFATSAATAVVNSSGFLGAEQALGAPDSSNATATGTATATLTVSGFGTLVPANAEVTNLTVRLTHQDLQHVGSVLITPIGSGGSPVCPPIAMTISSQMHTSGVLGNATSCALTADQVNGLRVKVEAIPAFPGDPLRPMIERIDSVTVEVWYGGTGLQGASGCVIATPYPVAGCARLKTGPDATLAIRGTVYAPRSPVDLRFGVVSVQSVSRGIIARTIRLNGAIGISIPGQPVGTPAPTTLSDRVVRLEASIGGVPKLRAEVRFHDGGGLTPGAAVRVDAWTFLT